jgi:ribonuclease HII
MESNYSGKIEAGIDEVGRGALAGPVVAAAVILPKDFKSENIKDSKKLTERRRKIAFEEIKENAIAWAVSFVEPKDIDNINIQNATFAAMHESVNKLSVTPEFLLVDGNIFETYDGIPHETIIKGDDKYLSIAAASVMAKVIRDEYMTKIHEKYPQYGWSSNKGYGSKQHRDTIQEEGITQFHRKSFLKKILQS